MQDIVRAVRCPSLSAAIFLTALTFTFSARLRAQDRRQPDVAAPVAEERIVGPYDVRVLAGGPALNKPIPATSRVLSATGAYTLSLWVELSAATPHNVLLAGLGD